MQGEGTSLLNFWVQDDQTEWVVTKGKGYFNKIGELRFISDSGDFWIRSSAVFSNISLCANVRFNKAESKADGDLSILLGCSPYVDNKIGLSVRIFHSGQIEVSQDGKLLCSTRLQGLDVNSFYLWINRSGKSLQISVASSYYDRELRCVLQCDLQSETGGALSFYGRNISGAISEFIATAQPSGDEEIVKIAKPTYIWLC